MEANLEGTVLLDPLQKILSAEVIKGYIILLLYIYKDNFRMNILT